MEFRHRSYHRHHRHVLERELEHELERVEVAADAVQYHRIQRAVPRAEILVIAADTHCCCFVDELALELGVALGLVGQARVAAVALAVAELAVDGHHDFHLDCQAFAFHPHELQ